MSWLLPSTCRTPQFTMAVPKGRASFLSFCKASRVPKDARPPLKRIWGKQGVLQSFWSCCIKVRKPLQHDETNQLRLSPNDPRILAKWKMDFWDSHNCLASRDTWKKNIQIHPSGTISILIKDFTVPHCIIGILIFTTTLQNLLWLRVRWHYAQILSFGRYMHYLLC